MSNSNNLKEFCLPHGEEKTNSSEKKEKRAYKYIENNAANYIERFNIPTVLVLIHVT
jgi:hypothetical protein